MQRKSVLTILLCIAMALLLTACACNHEWSDPTCTKPSTCELCGATDGEARGHSWLDPTCEDPSICRRCGKEKGDPAEHAWAAATCETAATCELCGATDGAALEHSWSTPTCTEPKTCELCGVVDGEAGEHSWTAATCQAPQTCSACGATEGDAAGHTEGDSEFVAADLVAATGTSETTCTVCGEVVSTETEDLPFLHAEGYFLFSVNEYVERLDNIMSQETTLYAEPYNNTTMDNVISCDMFSLDSSNGYFGYSFFYDGDYQLKYSDGDTQIAFNEVWTFLDSVSSDDTIDASNTVLTIMMALDPTLTWDAAYEVGTAMVDSGSIVHNGIEYTITVVDEAEVQRLFSAIIVE